MPKIHHPSFVAQLAKIVALALVIYFAPGLGLLAVNALGVGGIAGMEILSTAVIAALGDAAVQGLAVGVGAQAKFSVNEMLETGLSAGTLSGLSGMEKVGAFAGMGKTSINLTKALTLATTNVQAQLIEMRLGTREKFDAKEVGVQLAASLIASGINAEVESHFGANPAAHFAGNGIAKTMTAALGGAVTGTPVNIQSLAASMIGDTIADGIISSAAPMGQHAELDREIALAEQAVQLQVDTPSLIPEPSMEVTLTSQEVIGRNQGLYNSEHLIGQANIAEPSNWNRVAGGFQVMGGFAAMGSGAVMSATGLGAVVGIPYGLSGLDNAWTGAKQIWSGQHEKTNINHVLVSAGMDETTAENAQLVLDLSVPFGALSKAIPKVISSIGSATTGAIKQGLNKFGLFGGGGEGVELYRAVKPEELKAILESGSFQNPYGIEKKYFSSTYEGAKQYAQMAEKAFGDPPYKIIKTTLPKTHFDSLHSDLKETVDRGINAVLIPTERLPLLSKPLQLDQELITQLAKKGRL